MNRHTIITVIAIIAILIPFAYSAVNIYAAEKIKFRWSEPQEFNYFAMSNNGKVEFCNTVPLYVNLKSFQINPIYDSENKGAFVIESLSIDPSSSIIKEGSFSSIDRNVAQYLFMQMDFQLDGGDVRLDPDKMFVIVDIETPIIGIIPYSTTLQYSGIDFDKIMSSSDFPC